MKSVNRLKYEYDSIVMSLRCDVTDEDYNRLETRIADISALARFENRSVSLYDVNRREFLLKVDRHIELLGYDPGEAFNINDINAYHSMIHPDDVKFMYDSEIRMYSYLNAIRDDSKKNYKLVYDYRVRGRSGNYVRFLHQMALFELDKNFNSWIVLVISDVLSMFPEEYLPRRFLIDTGTNRVVLFNDEAGVKSYLITRKEMEVLQLVSHGLDSAEIARRMHISINTVNNHRQNILQKTSTRNTPQAITYLKCIGIL